MSFLQNAPQSEPAGLIFDVQGHSVHDGPGARTLVFFSGCGLRCAWCANPEGRELRRRLMYKAQLCRDCPARCVEACAQGAAQPADHGAPIRFDRARCDYCDRMECVDVCYRGALQRSGRWYTVEELMRVFRRDRDYWGAEGGVTLSGGEPLVQADFVASLVRRCHDEYISVCLETHACVPRAALQAVLPYVEWLLVDLKHPDSARHLAGTGVSNETILENIAWIASSGWPGRMVVRMAIIPGYNDTAQTAEEAATFLERSGLGEINLLPFHRLGASKYEQLGKPYDYAQVPALAPEALEPLARVYRSRGIRCYVGAETPF
jgi:pyruvate formate lyase activating enzyme